MSKINRRCSKEIWIGLIVLIFSLTVVMLVGSAAAQVDAEPTLSLDPAGPVIVTVGNDVDIDIRIDDVTNVYGAEVGLSFDETLLQVTRGQLTPGACPQPDFVQTNSANNSTGVIDYVVTQLNPTPPCNGGVMATINFECIAVGESSVAFTSSIISDNNANAIVHTAVGGSVKCEQPVIEIIGSVALQGWPDPTGAKVTLYDSEGIVDGPMVVGTDGTFKLLANDETKTYRVVAESDRYLSAEATGLTGTSGTVIDLGLAQLRAGDINGDGVINILDLTVLAGNFYKSSPQTWAP